MRPCGSVRGVILFLLGFTLSGCGTHIPEINEFVDAADPSATQHLEKQIKLAVFCELRDALRGPMAQYTYFDANGQDVSTKEDSLLPEDWGAQVTLTLTVDELTKLSPGVAIASPVGPVKLAQTVTAGLGGVLSSDANRVDKFESFYTVKDVKTVYSKYDDCRYPPKEIGLKSSSSPFTILSDLGIRKWLPAAADVNAYLRSSRKSSNGIGPALGTSGSFVSDSFSYDIRFTIVSDFNGTPVLKLVRVTTPSSPALLDTSRTRTHELLITIAPPSSDPSKKGLPDAAAQSHFIQEFAGAVATALHQQGVTTFTP